jgi:hypothetical protein
MAQFPAGNGSPRARAPAHPSPFGAADAIGARCGGASKPGPGGSEAHRERGRIRTGSARRRRPPPPTVFGPVAPGAGAIHVSDLEESACPALLRFVQHEHPQVGRVVLTERAAAAPPNDSPRHWHYRRAGGSRCPYRQAARVEPRRTSRDRDGSLASARSEPAREDGAHRGALAIPNRGASPRRRSAGARSPRGDR